MESLKDAGTPTVGQKVLTSITATIWDLYYYTNHRILRLNGISLKDDLALESKSKCYPKHQENFLPQNRFLFETLQFKHSRILKLKRGIKNPKVFAGEGRDE